MHSRRRSPRVRPRHVFAALVAVGLLLRVLTFNSWGIVYDGAVMSVMGQSFAVHGEFLVPYAAVPTYYHHYPPLYPVFLSLFYRALGFGVFATKLAELVLSALLVVVTWLTTADLFGRRKAWYAAAFVALEPMFLITSLIGYSEDLVGILFIVWGGLTMLIGVSTLALGAGALALLTSASRGGGRRVAATISICRLPSRPGR